MSDWFADVPPDAHWLTVGGTRRGKSGLAQLRCRSLIKSGMDGLTAIDPHGAFARAVAEWASNPQNGVGYRRLHLFNIGADYTFALNPLQSEHDQPSWEECHEAANVVLSSTESFFDQSSQSTPRQARVSYVASFVLARHGLTLLELPELLSLGTHELRRTLLNDFQNRIVRRELQELHDMAVKNSREFFTLVESTKNRWVRWLADPRLARIFGQKKGLNPRAVMDSRDIVLIDLSAFNYDDAAFLGTMAASMYFAAARRRPPLQCARHRLLLDEAESLITTITSRMVDQTAKFGLTAEFYVQRWGQLLAKGPFIADALTSNCPIQVAFAIQDPVAARYWAEFLFTPFIDLQEYKENTRRPVVVGHAKQMVANRSRAEMEAVSEMQAHSRSHALGSGRGTFSGASTAIGSGIGSGQSSGQVLTPPVQLFGPNAPDASILPYPTSQSIGDSSSRSTFEQQSNSTGETYSEFEMSGESETSAHGTSRGTSRSEGASECFVPIVEWLPTELYSLEDQLTRLTGELMSMPRRECFVRVEDRRPFRMRTADLTPAYRSELFKTYMLPLYLENSIRHSPYLRRCAEVDAEIEARFAPTLPPPEKAEPETWREPFDYPDPPPPPDAPRTKPKLRVVRPDVVEK